MSLKLWVKCRHASHEIADTPYPFCLKFVLAMYQEVPQVWESAAESQPGAVHESRVPLHALH